MSNPTTPFNWQMPTNTDLVTDLPADFEVFGQAVATSMQDLLGGTTGQILSKASNTDMDFTWTSANPGDITGVTAGTGISGGGTSGDVTVTNSMATAIDAKGDLIVGTGADAFSRLAVGANNTVLTADSAEATGLKWAAPSSSSGPTFGVYRGTSAQSFAQNTWVKIQLNAESWDTANAFDSTTNYRFTPATAGYYQINIALNINVQNVPANIAINAYKNGSNYANLYRMAANDGNNEVIGGGTIIYLNGTTDYLEFYIYSSGNNTRQINDDTESRATGVWIRS